MEQSKALHQLGEVADLIAMIETLTSPNVADPSRNASAWAGLRITLRNARETLLSSLEVLSADMVNKAKARIELPAQESSEISPRTASPVKHLASSAPVAASAQIPANGAKLERRDLRAQLERIVDRQ